MEVYVEVNDKRYTNEDQIEYLHNLNKIKASKDYFIWISFFLAERITSIAYRILMI
jgi:hypothetical protein